MTTAHWCILGAGLMPFLWTILAKSSSLRTFDNNNPRIFLERLQGWPQRANWAQINSFEAFPLFAAAVLVALQVGNIDSQTLDTLAVTYLISRLIYGVFYLLDWGWLRTLVWFVGVGCCISLFILSA